LPQFNGFSPDFWAHKLGFKSPVLIRGGDLPQADVQRLDELGRALLAEAQDEEGVDLFATSEASYLGAVNPFFTCLKTII